MIHSRHREIAPLSRRDNKANCGPNVRKPDCAFVYERFQLRLVMPADGHNSPSSVACRHFGRVGEPGETPTSLTSLQSACAAQQ